MERNKQMEQFSIAFVTAIAAQAGCNHSQPKVDDDSVDLTLFSKKVGQLREDPALNIQLKSTSENVSFTNSILKYELHNLKNYNDLRKTNLQTPRILVVVYLPENNKDWIKYKDESIHLYRNVFWLSLRGQPEILNKTSITLSIPTSQKFNAEELDKMMNKIAKGDIEWATAV